MAGRVGVLHHRRSFFPPALQSAVGDAAELVWVLVDDGLGDDPISHLTRRLGDVVEIPRGDLDAAAEALAGAQLDGIVTFVDDHLSLAAALAQRLGLIYHPPEVAAAIRNKDHQRAKLDGAGVAGPRFWPLPAGLDRTALASAAAEVTYPAVLKPARGSGSRGIVHVANAQHLLRLYDDQIDQLLEEHLLDDPRTDPRFASYLSVESVVSHGRVSHVALTGRFRLALPYRETGNFMPAAVPTGQQDAILELATAAIRALEIDNAAVHTEIKLTPNGPRLIEVNGRIGGRPPFVLLSVSEVNLFQAACRIALGEPVSFDSLAECSGVGFWRMIQPPLAARRVCEVHGVEPVRALPWVNNVNVMRGAGQVLNAEDGTDGAVMVITGKVANLDELAGAITQLDTTLSVDYEFAGEPPGSELEAPPAERSDRLSA